MFSEHVLHDSVEHDAPASGTVHYVDLTCQRACTLIRIGMLCDFPRRPKSEIVLRRVNPGAVLPSHDISYDNTRPRQAEETYCCPEKTLDLITLSQRGAPLGQGAPRMTAAAERLYLSLW